jgi:argininosuccinate lyase
MTGGAPLESAAFIVSPAQIALDTAMLRHDIWGTQAHTLMLAATGIIPGDAARRILAALRDVDAAAEAGAFQIDPARGAQLSLERAVIDRVGVADGSRMHTARSRNDQVMVTELLYLRERALTLAGETTGLVATLLDLAAAHVTTVMPGYTHMQPAKPTSFGQWALSYADAILRGLGALRHAWEEFDACPLGAVESYGASWPIDRALTARLLGFSRVWELPQDAIGARGLPQLAYLDVCKRLALTVSKIAADLLLFTTWEYGYVELGAAIAQRLHPITGSSVMAQKKNPDALELLRATGHEVIGLAGTAAHVLAGLPMGYNRDTRELKEWSALGFDKTLAAVGILRATLATLSVNEARMAAAVRANYSSTTDLADAIAQRTGVGYRQIYAVVGKLVDGLIERGAPLSSLSAATIVEAAAQAGLEISLSDAEIAEALDPARALAQRRHIGGAAPAEMARLLAERQTTLGAWQAWVADGHARIAAARAETNAAIGALDPAPAGAPA